MKKSDFKFTTADELARETIVNEIDTNLFVEAGAGSGKTTMLVNRIVAMIEGGLDIKKICAITFTKNAALEFYERLQAKLIERSNPNFKEPDHFFAGDLDIPTDTTRKRCEEALSNIDLCFMGTIDSFCNMILSEHPTEANIPSDASLISNEEAAEIYKQFYIDAREGIYGLDIKRAIKKYSILFYSPEDIFADLMSEIMDRRNVNFTIDDDFTKKSFREFFNRAMKDTKSVLKTFNKDKSKITVKLESYDKRNPDDVYNSACANLFRNWEYNFASALKSIKDIKGLTYLDSPDSLGFTNECIVRESGGNTILTVNDKESSGGLIHQLNEYRYQNSLNLVLMCVKPLEEKMRQMGKFTFFDYLYYLREMLVKDSKNGGKLIEYIYNRHSYFLIDEFQDTNPMQAEVFFYLAAKDPNKSSWKNCVPKAGSLFIVGDPKQSIYRFRSADVSSYNEIRKIFSNPEVGKVRYLANNFRSKGVVKTYFNDTFHKVFNEEDEKAKIQISPEDKSEYMAIENLTTPKEVDGEFKGNYFYESYSDSLLDEYPDFADEERITRIIKNLVNNKTKLLADKNGNLRPITYKDFMIIFSGKKKMSKYIAKFNEEKIPVRVEGKVLFEKCDGLITIYNLFKALTLRSDNVSLVAALYSPVFGLNENDVCEYVKKGNKLKIDFKKEYGNTNIEIALYKLKETSLKINNLTPSSLYENIIDDFEIFKYVSSDKLEIVYYTLELIRNEERAGNIVTYEDAVIYLENLLSGESGQERCLVLRSDIDAVHLANLHKVKGLEAPIVILAKAGNKSATPNIRIEYKEDPTTNEQVTNGYIFSIKPEGVNFKTIETDKYSEKGDLEEKEKGSLKAEDDRLVYVAATRARNVLIVAEPYMKRSGKPSRMGSKWKKLKENIKENIFDVVPDNPDYKEPEVLLSSGKELMDNSKTLKVSKEETYKFMTPSKLANEEEVKKPSKATSDESIEFTSNYKDTPATIVGTMVHRLMEMMIMSNDTIDQETLVSNIISEYLTVEFEYRKDLIIKTLNDVYNTIHNGGYKQVNGCEDDILTELKNSEEKISEVPFTYKEENNLWNGIIDLLYKKDGEWHIVDWKTNKDAEGLNEHYKPQLEAYIKALKQTCGIDVKDAKIYHIAIK